MQLPVSLLQSLEGIPGFDRDSFVQVHESGQAVTSVRINPAKAAASSPSLFDQSERVPWSTEGIYLQKRPSFTLDPLFHAGVYYVQEASSMFIEQALRQTTDLSKPLRVLDLCAAPGGKSTLLQSLITHDSLLLSNEVIKSRASILEENLTKWGAVNTIVTNNDPAVIAQLENFFDVIVVDAPCSGSGLFHRDPEAMKEWSEQAVQLCYQRQQRILADIYPALKQDGILIYSTCSYSKEEDEDIADWLMDSFEMESLSLTTDPSWNIVTTQSGKHNAWGYRFFPDKVKGEGLYVACFRKKDGDSTKMRPPKKSALQKLSKKEQAVVAPWLNPEIPVQLWKQGEWIQVFPAALENELLIIAATLYVRKAGVTAGKIAGDELVPDHALAVSTVISDQIVAVTLKKEEALQYLRKEEVKLAIPHKGWTLIQFEGVNLGWIKVLPNRINNYYPANWRILKSGNN